MAYYDRLKEARKKAGLTQKQMADYTGIAVSTYNGYETGKSEPSMLYLSKFMEILSIDANFLFQDEVSELHNDTFSFKEKEVISKYRALSDDSKTVVDALLDVLYERENPDEFIAHIEPPPKRDIAEDTK